MAKTWVCDWSHWQGELPAEQVEKEGFGAVKLKCGGATKEGWSYIDPWFIRNANALRRTKMVPLVYWYLMPGMPWAQAGALFDMLDKVGSHMRWGVFLDVEEPGLTPGDIQQWGMAWRQAVARDYNPHPFVIYTRKSYWAPNIDGARGGTWGKQIIRPLLEEAHWVPKEIRYDPALPYASQQAHSVMPSWWDVNYSGWTRAFMLQFTDRALIAGKLTCASLYEGTKEQLRAALTVQ